MKILYVSNVDPDPNSGASGTDIQTIQALRNQGHSVDAVWRNDLGSRLRHPAMQSILELPSRLRSATICHPNFKAYDVFLVNQPYAYLGAKRLRRGNPSKIFVIRSHGFEARAETVLSGWHKETRTAKREFWKIPLGWFVDFGVRRACRLAAKYADGILVSSNADKTFIVNSYGLADNKVACIPQAVPPLFLEKPCVPFSPARMDRIMYVGPSQFHKGYTFLLQAIVKILQENNRLKFTWICNESEHQGIRAALPVDIHEQVRLEAYCTQDELMSHYDSCGIFLFPSLFEGFGKAPLEAMSRGLCVVATRVGGMADIINTGNDGLLVEPGQANEIYQSVRYLFEDTRRAEKISLKARETASKYTWDRSAIEISRWLEELKMKKINAQIAC